MKPHKLEGALTQAAIRMRRLRDRRRRGFRCVTIEVSLADAEVLVEHGLLECGDEGGPSRDRAGDRRGAGTVSG